MGRSTHADQDQLRICLADRSCDLVSNRHVRRTHGCDFRARRKRAIGVEEVGRGEDLAVGVVHGLVAVRGGPDCGSIASENRMD